MSVDENLWYVKTGDGDVHRVTLDQLDEAFQAGRIDENVMVLGGSATRWTKLGQLAGLDEPQAPPPVASSLRPFSMDLSLDVDDENVFRKKSRKGLVFGSLFVVLAAFGGFLAVNHGQLGSYNVFNALHLAAAAPAPPPAPPADPLPVVPDPPAAAPAPDPATTAAASTADSSASKLSDDQRAKLAAADKAMDLKMKGHKKGRGTGGSASHSSSKYKSQGFTTGGNKFDPLNASF